MRVRDRVRPGAVVLELALILPVLVFLALLCVDFGRFAYHHVAVQNAARAGAGYATATTVTDAGGEAAWEAAAQEAARAEMTQQTHYDRDRLTVAVVPGTDAYGLRRVGVTATYTGFHTVVPWPLIPNNPTLRASVVMPAIR